MKLYNPIINYKIKNFIKIILKFHPTLNICYNVNLEKFNTFKIKSNSFILFEVQNLFEIQSIVILLNQFDIKYLIIGNGSNILFNDQLYYDIIISFKKFMNQIIIDNNYIIGQSGVMISHLCKKALKYSLSGIEFAYGIPGTLGGLIYMNAGAFGHEIKDILIKIKYLDFNGNIDLIDSKEFTYRNSYFSKNKKLIILEAIIKLEYDTEENILNKMKKNIKFRKEKHPMSLPNMGSIFKRPGTNIFPGKLIEECGLKGLAIGNAQISEKHCGFIINKGNAKTSDVIKLINYIKYKVYEKFSIKLECEINII